MFVNPEHNQKVAKYSGLTLFRADIQVPGREPYVRVGTLRSLELKIAAFLRRDCLECAEFAAEPSELIDNDPVPIDEEERRPDDRSAGLRLLRHRRGGFNFDPRNDCRLRRDPPGLGLDFLACQ